MQVASNAIDKRARQLQQPIIPTTGRSSIASADAADESKHARSVISDSIIAPKPFSNATNTDAEVWLNYFLTFAELKRPNKAVT